MNKNKIMIFWELIIIISLIAVVFAVITDIKSREVPNWISFTLIAIGIFSKLIYSIINSDFSYIVYGIIGLLIGTFIGFIMYYTKQWGGGDAKLLIGLTTIFISYEGITLFNSNINIPFLFILITNIIIFGGLYGMIYGLFLAIKNLDKFKEEWRKNKHPEIIIGIILLFILPLIGIIFLKPLFYFTLILGIISLFLIVMLEIARTVEKICMYKKIPSKKLVEGDWIADDIKKGNKIIYKAKSIELKQKDIDNIIKNRIKEVLVKEGIPFIPGFLIGLVISLVFGNWII